MKIKLSKSGKYSIKGLSPKHLEAIRALVWHTRLGDCYYEEAAYDLARMFDAEYFEDVNYEDCTLDVDVEDDTPTINLSHFND